MACFFCSLEIEYPVLTDGETSAVLQEADLGFVNISHCEKSYQNLPFYDTRWPNGMSSNDTLCALDPTDQSRDACQVNNQLKYY